MIRINLLPADKRPSLYPAGEYILLAVAGVVFLLCAAAASFNYWQIRELNMQAAQIDRQQMLLKNTAAHMETAGKRRREIEVKTDFLINLTNERISAYSFLCRTSDIVIPQIWLSEASWKNNGDGADINLKGTALTYDDIAVFLGKLEQDEYLQNAVLLKAEKIDSLGGAHFEIAVQMKKL